MSGALPCLKGLFPFRLALPSYIAAGDIETNLLFLGPCLDAVTLLFFENALPSVEDVRRCRDLGREHGLCFSAHLPLDLFTGTYDPALAVLAFSERLAPLDPSCLVVHCDPKDPAGNLDLARAEAFFQGLAAQGADFPRLAFENLDFPFAALCPLIEAYKARYCLDVGHFLLCGEDPVKALNALLPNAAMLHLHAVAQGRDHHALDAFPEPLWRSLVPVLKRCRTELTLEVFSLDRVLASLPRLLELADQPGERP